LQLLPPASHQARFLVHLRRVHRATRRRRRGFQQNGIIDAPSDFSAPAPKQQILVAA
jgi:hypothetical protein